MKNRIDDIYNDGETIFTDNTYILNDPRMSIITPLINDLDLITQFSYGTREIFKRFLQHDDTDVYVYDLVKIKKATYACIVDNLTKYNVMLNADDAITEIDPTVQFSKTTVYGAQEKATAYGATTDATQYGQKERTDVIASRVNTTQHGTKTTTDNIGSATDTQSNGARTSTGAVTSFSSDTFHDTEKATENAVVDTTQYGSHTDTRQESQLNDVVTDDAHTDRFTDASHTDTRTKSSHTDTTTDATHTDHVTGYNDGVESIEKYYRYSIHNTVKEIVNDVVNTITYNMYLF